MRNGYRSEPAIPWNVVVTTLDARGLRPARRFFAGYGQVERTSFYNVLVVKVADTDQFLRSMSEAVKADLGILNDVSRVVPAQETFDFESVADFEQKALAVVLQWLNRLAGRSFHVRLHKRQGDLPFKLSSFNEEKTLDEGILRRLTDLGQPGRIAFSDPDFVINIETVGHRAGMSIWSREELKTHPFLRPD